MKTKLRALALAMIAWPLVSLQAQKPMTEKEGAASKPTDVYHVFIAKAAPGKAKEMENWLKEPDPKDPKAKILILRHEEGDSWDFVVIQYMGKSAKVEVGEPNTMTPQQRSLVEWHGDTFVSGPPWAAFAKEMGLEGAAAKSADSVYLVSDYRAVAGQRDALEKSLSTPPQGDTASGNILLAHLEGAPWNFLAIARYDSWDKVAESEKASMAQTKQGQGGWYELRESCAQHHDTLTDRVSP
ncbi:MAG TPA: hypothetical protein VGF73_04465 [Chthoniobacterales bacterium]